MIYIRQKINIISQIINLYFIISNQMSSIDNEPGDGAGDKVGTAGLRMKDSLSGGGSSPQKQLEEQSQSLADGSGSGQYSGSSNFESKIEESAGSAPESERKKLSQKEQEQASAQKRGEEQQENQSPHQEFQEDLQHPDSSHQKSSSFIISYKYQSGEPTSNFTMSGKEKSGQPSSNFIEPSSNFLDPSFADPSSNFGGAPSSKMALSHAKIDPSSKQASSNFVFSGLQSSNISQQIIQSPDEQGYQNQELTKVTERAEEFQKVFTNESNDSNQFENIENEKQINTSIIVSKQQSLSEKDGNLKRNMGGKSQTSVPSKQNTLNSKQGSKDSSERQVKTSKTLSKNQSEKSRYSRRDGKQKVQISISSKDKSLNSQVSKQEQRVIPQNKFESNQKSKLLPIQEPQNINADQNNLIAEQKSEMSLNSVFVDAEFEDQRLRMEGVRQNSSDSESRGLLSAEKQKMVEVETDGKLKKVEKSEEEDSVELNIYDLTKKQENEQVSNKQYQESYKDTIQQMKEARIKRLKMKDILGEQSKQATNDFFSDIRKRKMGNKFGVCSPDLLSPYQNQLITFLSKGTKSSRPASADAPGTREAPRPKKFKNEEQVFSLEGYQSFQDSLNQAIQEGHLGMTTASRMQEAIRQKILKDLNTRMTFTSRSHGQQVASPAPEPEEFEQMTKDEKLIRQLYLELKKKDLAQTSAIVDLEILPQDKPYLQFPRLLESQQEMRNTESILDSEKEGENQQKKLSQRIDQQNSQDSLVEVARKAKISSKKKLNKNTNQSYQRRASDLTIRSKKGEKYGLKKQKTLISKINSSLLDVHKSNDAQLDNSSQQQMIIDLETQQKQMKDQLNEDKKKEKFKQLSHHFYILDENSKMRYDNLQRMDKLLNLVGDTREAKQSRHGTGNSRQGSSIKVSAGTRSKGSTFVDRMKPKEQLINVDDAFQAVNAMKAANFGENSKSRSRSRSGKKLKKNKTQQINQNQKWNQVMDYMEENPHILMELLPQTPPNKQKAAKFIEESNKKLKKNDSMGKIARERQESKQSKRKDTKQSANNNRNNKQRRSLVKKAEKKEKLLLTPMFPKRQSAEKSPSQKANSPKKNLVRLEDQQSGRPLATQQMAESDSSILDLDIQNSEENKDGQPIQLRALQTPHDEFSDYLTGIPSSSQQNNMFRTNSRGGKRSSENREGRKRSAERRRQINNNSEALTSELGQLRQSQILFQRPDSTIQKFNRFHQRPATAAIGLSRHKFMNKRNNRQYITGDSSLNDMDRGIPSRAVNFTNSSQRDLRGGLSSKPNRIQTAKTRLLNPANQLSHYNNFSSKYNISEVDTDQITAMNLSHPSRDQHMDQVRSNYLRSSSALQGTRIKQNYGGSRHSQTATRWPAVSKVDSRVLLDRHIKGSPERGQRRMIGPQKVAHGEMQSKISRIMWEQKVKNAKIFSHHSPIKNIQGQRLANLVSSSEFDSRNKDLNYDKPQKRKLSRSKDRKTENHLKRVEKLKQLRQQIKKSKSRERTNSKNGSDDGDHSRMRKKKKKSKGSMNLLMQDSSLNNTFDDKPTNIQIEDLGRKSDGGGSNEKKSLSSSTHRGYFRTQDQVYDPSQRRNMAQKSLSNQSILLNDRSFAPDSGSRNNSRLNLEVVSDPPSSKSNINKAITPKGSKGSINSKYQRKHKKKDRKRSKRSHTGSARVSSSKSHSRSRDPSNREGTKLTKMLSGPFAQEMMFSPIGSVGPLPINEQMAEYLAAESQKPPIAPKQQQPIKSPSPGQDLEELQLSRQINIVENEDGELLEEGHTPKREESEFQKEYNQLSAMRDWKQIGSPKEWQIASENAEKHDYRKEIIDEKEELLDDTLIIENQDENINIQHEDEIQLDRKMDVALGVNLHIRNWIKEKFEKKHSASPANRLNRLSQIESVDDLERLRKSLKLNQRSSIGHKSDFPKQDNLDFSFKKDRNPFSQKQESEIVQEYLSRQNRSNYNQDLDILETDRAKNDGKLSMKKQAAPRFIPFIQIQTSNLTPNQTPPPTNLYNYDEKINIIGNSSKQSKQQEINQPQIHDWATTDVYQGCVKNVARFQKPPLNSPRALKLQNKMTMLRKNPTQFKRANDCTLIFSEAMTFLHDLLINDISMPILFEKIKKKHMLELSYKTTLSLIIQARIAQQIKDDAKLLLCKYLDIQTNEKMIDQLRNEQVSDGLVQLQIKKLTRDCIWYLGRARVFLADYKKTMKEGKIMVDGQDTCEYIQDVLAKFDHLEKAYREEELIGVSKEDF